jgi:sporulation protein YlmC with PRC-barrel domain
MSQDTIAVVPPSVVDVAALASTYPVKDLLGAEVVNERGETIGQVDDLLIHGETDEVAYAVLYVGGFLGIGAHRVVVNIHDLAIDGAVILRGGSKEALKGLLAYDPAEAHGPHSPLNRPRRGVKETGKAVRTAFGEPIPGGVADVTDED